MGKPSKDTQVIMTNQSAPRASPQSRRLRLSTLVMLNRYTERVAAANRRFDAGPRHRGICGHTHETQAHTKRLPTLGKTAENHLEGFLKTGLPGLVLESFQVEIPTGKETERQAIRKKRHTPSHETTILYNRPWSHRARITHAHHSSSFLSFQTQALTQGGQIWHAHHRQEHSTSFLAGP